jgi:hypothetical protein
MEVPKKAKTRRPPRPVQAPTRREDKRSGLSAVPRWAFVAAAVALAAVVAAVAYAQLKGGSSDTSASVKSAMTAAGCTYRDVAPLPPKNPAKTYHADVPTLTSKVKWSTFPPSGGAHYGLWAIWGFYREPVNPRQVVHNLEHGAIAIWWGPKVPAATVDKLQAFYQEKPAGMFGTPLAGLGKKIALTAWTGDPAEYYRKGNYGMGHIGICRRFDEQAFRSFRDAYRGKGPEGIPLSADEPGMGPQ